MGRKRNSDTLPPRVRCNEEAEVRKARWLSMNSKYVVLVFAATISLIILVLSLFLFYEAFSLPADRLASVKDAFDITVAKVLLPMFTTVVTAALTYIFGKQLVSAVSDRLRAEATNKNSSERAQ